MGAPQIIYCVLWGISLCASAYLHGKPRDPHNFWIVLLSKLIVFPLLIWGGFFG